MPIAISRRALLGTAAAAWAAAGTPRVQGATPKKRVARLSANENPYGPGPKARAAIQAAVAESCRYSIGSYTQLLDALARHENVARENIVLGAGSGELLHMLALEYVGRGELVTAWPTFNQITAYAEKLGASVKRVPLDAAMRHDLPAMAQATTGNTGLVYVCNPNNPTGTAVDGSRLHDFCRAVAQHALVVVDEASLELVEPGATASMVDLARAGENVIVLRTFSKIHGLAGLRIGYGIGEANNMARLRRMQMTFPNTIGLEAALASLNDAEFLAQTKRALSIDRRRMVEVCRALGLDCTDSQGNFIFVNTGMPASQFRERMLAHSIEVGRNFEPYSNWCRVSVGTRAETDQFLAALPRVAAA